MDILMATLRMGLAVPSVKSMSGHRRPSWRLGGRENTSIGPKCSGYAPSVRHVIGRLLAVSGLVLLPVCSPE